MGTPFTLSKLALDTLLATFSRQGIEPSEPNIRVATLVAYKEAAMQVFAQHDENLLAKVVAGELSLEFFLGNDDTGVAEDYEGFDDADLRELLDSFANRFYLGAAYAEGMFDALKQRPQTPLYAYNELPSKLQEQLRNSRINTLIDAICEGYNLEFLGIEHLADKIGEAFNKAHKMRTPWFVGEYIMEAVGDQLTAKVADELAETLYLNGAKTDANVVVLGW